MMKRLGSVLVPLVILAIAAVISVGLVSARPGADSAPKETPEPLVRVVDAFPEEVEFVVVAQGEARPLAEIDLVAEVEGKVVEVSDNLAAGAFFDRGEVLLRIDPRQFELAVSSARADVAKAATMVAAAGAESAAARRDWNELHPDRVAPSLVAREPQLAEARAAVDAAKARLARAELDLDRTTLVAPFEGRVASEEVSPGRFVTRGHRLATIYSTDAVEIRLPIADRELAFLDVSLGHDFRRAEEVQGSSPRAQVRLSAMFAGARREWMGEVVRVEGHLDPQTRMVGLVATVQNPYGGGDNGVPLAVGMFVDAEILGRKRSGVFVLPRAALREGDRVLVVDSDNRLNVVDVEVLRTQPGQILVGSGLTAGQRVCVSPLEVVVDGMRVRVAEEAPADTATARATAESVK